MSYKKVFAYIIRSADERYRGMTIGEIRDMIDDNPESDYLGSMDKEFARNGVRTVTDGRYIINVPGGGRMIVDMEMQSFANTGMFAMTLRQLKTA